MAIIKSLKGATSALALICAGLAPDAAFSGQVTLSASDGSLELSGDFVEFADGHYVIRTPLGEMRVSAARVGCSGEACPTIDTSNVSLRIAGAGALSEELVPLLISGFATHTNSDVDFQVLPENDRMLSNLVAEDGFGDAFGSILISPSDNDSVFEALGNGDIDVAISTRRITRDEVRALRNKGAGNMVAPGQEQVLAVDSVMIVTHPDNPVAEIGMEQLRDVYRGVITNWSELGGPDMAIQLIAQDPATPARQTFESVLFNGASVTPVGDVASAKSDIEAAAFVNRNAGGLGFLPFGVQRGTKALNIVDACGIVSAPTEFNAKTEEYPFVRRTYLYVRGDFDNEMGQQFLDYGLSDAADDVISQAGFVSLGIARNTGGMALSATVAEQQDAFEAGVFENMVETAAGFERLTTTFHFRTGSSRLDARGKADLDRLVSYLGEQPEGTRVKLVGFSDDIGRFDSNQRLSLRRADRIKDFLETAASEQLSGIEFTSSGFGEIAPVSCNATREGRFKNRRVEIWIERPVQG